MNAVLASVAFYALVTIGTGVVRRLMAGHLDAGPRAQATIRLTGSIVGQVATILLLALYLRRRGGSLADLGFGRPARRRGFIAAGVLALLTIALMLGGPLRGRAPLAEASLFHLYTSAVAGLGAGFCEEILFRGFVTTELSLAGAGRVVQVLASGLLFGLAHAGWSTLGASFDLRLLLGSVVPTAVFGMLYAVVYLVGGRSLTPVIAGHVATDMVIEPWLILAALSGSVR
jgi:membrane protease YdiL (CAAX protease family)